MLFENMSNIKQKSMSGNNEFDSVLDSFVLFYLKQNTIQEKIPLKEFIRHVEKRLIYITLEITSGSQKNAAEILGVRTSTLNIKLKKYDIFQRNSNFNILNSIEEKLKLVKNI